MKFNGIRLTRGNDSVVRMEQRDKIEKLTIPTNDKEFASKHAMVQYIGVNFHPDVCAPVQLVAPGQEQTTKEGYK